MFIAIDGDSTGKIIEKMILAQELDELYDFSNSLQSKILSIGDFIVDHSGRIIMAGGDNILAEMPGMAKRDKIQGLEKLLFEEYSFSVAISDSVQGAYLGLKYAKAAKIKMVKTVVTSNGEMKFYDCFEDIQAF